MKITREQNSETERAHWLLNLEKIIGGIRTWLNFPTWKDTRHRNHWDDRLKVRTRLKTRQIKLAPDKYLEFDVTGSNGEKWAKEVGNKLKACKWI